LRQKSPFLLGALAFVRRLHLTFLFFAYELIISSSFIFLLFLFLLITLLRSVVIAQWNKRPLDHTKAHIVLPNNGRIQTVEIQQQNKILIESFKWIKHMPTLIFFAVLFLIIMFLFFEFVRDNQISFDAFMHDKVLVSFGTLELE